ncbi:YggS family pyridoxal phosphate-dependent enzyme [Nautilia sp. PV-1]|uniref:YggS family pyridoxal phosphate-dependent enzyme n=1 Tax=Nautilia sp. PV-1 TaxID=2579250 RepID=UPI000FD6E32D|nr:YggS family pyridoxal phosphate-dependent enzyme [Nautilia sp. PV-1]AZV46648.1 YggS family pyridoxal phosphate-dependent enzyme [Nautilia sp. PV-1]
MTLDELIQRVEEARLRRSEHLIVQIVAVTKYTKDTEPLRKLYNEGQRAFGENRVQDMEDKVNALSDLPIEWHFIGNLQKNKINKLLKLNPFMIQSINSYELAEAINKRTDKPVRCLLEINSAKEPTKHGLQPELAVETYLKIKENLPNINLQGVMTIGAHVDDEEEIRKSFRLTYKIFEQLKPYGAKICSMGMSGDFEIAIEEGSNMIRVGSALLNSYL